MNLPETKKLKQIVTLCRKMGVESIEIDGIKITLGAEPSKPIRKQAKKVAVPDNGKDDIESESPTDQELLFWSTGAPEEGTRQ